MWKFYFHKYIFSIIVVVVVVEFTLVTSILSGVTLRGVTRAVAYSEFLFSFWRVDVCSRPSLGLSKYPGTHYVFHFVTLKFELTHRKLLCV